MVTLAEYAAGLSKLSAEGDITLISGNEASDADSIISALLYAYLLSEDHDSSAGKPVAVVKCRREDVRLRSETVLLLQYCRVDVNNLIFLDDMCAEDLIKRTTRLILTDHNAADGPLISLAEKVVEILDHHKDLGAHEHVKGELRNIAFEGAAATAASACTVLGEKYLAHPKGKDVLARDNAAAARALLGVILIDSLNLDPKAKKVCPRDIDVARALMEITADPTQDALFRALDDAKFSREFWSGLQANQCLRYDFKCFNVNSGGIVGISSVLCPLTELATKLGFESAAKDYLEKYDFYLVMTSSKADSGALLKSLAVMCKDDASCQKISDFLQSYQDSLLQLEFIDHVVHEGFVRKNFHQKNIGASRKQVAPGCIAYLEATASL